MEKQPTLVTDRLLLRRSTLRTPRRCSGSPATTRSRPLSCYPYPYADGVAEAWMLLTARVREGATCSLRRHPSSRAGLRGRGRARGDQPPPRAERSSVTGWGDLTGTVGTPPRLPGRWIEYGFLVLKLHRIYAMHFSATALRSGDGEVWDGAWAHLGAWPEVGRLWGRWCLGILHDEWRQRRTGSAIRECRWTGQFNDATPV